VSSARGTLYAYAFGNFVDGKRFVGDIRNAVAADYGPIPIDVAVDSIKAREEATIVTLR
jgi:hypothetical protein